jgi:hypothetical protein
MKFLSCTTTGPVVCCAKYNVRILIQLLAYLGDWTLNPVVELLSVDCYRANGRCNAHDANVVQTKTTDTGIAIERDLGIHLTILNMCILAS